jgi:hypothetical protein
MGQYRVKVRRQGGDLFWPIMLGLLAVMAGVFFYWSQNAQQQASRPIRHRQVAARSHARPAQVQPTAAPESEPPPGDQPETPDYPQAAPNVAPAPGTGYGPQPGGPPAPYSSARRTPTPAPSPSSRPQVANTPNPVRTPVIAGSPGGVRGSGLRHADNPPGYNDPLPPAGPVSGYDHSNNDAGAPRGY